MANTLMDNNYYQLKKEERQWQDETGNKLIDESYKFKGTRYVYEKQFDRIINRLKIKSGAVIIEIGCGRGQFLNYLEKQFYSESIELIGLDLSSKLMEVKKRNPSKHIHYITGDGEKLPFADNSADIVIYNGSLHHMPDFSQALHEAFRVAGDDGQIILYEPVSTTFSRAIHHLCDPFVFKRVKYESPVDEFCKDSFRPELLYRIITEAGYIYSRDWYDFLAYPLTGCYAGSYFSDKLIFFSFLLRIESIIQKIPLLKKGSQFLCWRLLLDVKKTI